MHGMSRPTKKLGRWLRRHSLTLVAALGGAAGVAYAAGWHSPSTARATAVEIQPIAAIAPEPVRDEVQDTVQIAQHAISGGRRGRRRGEKPECHPHPRQKVLST